MFEVGDKVFYPMYGAGVIEAIEEKEILGETQLYYILHIAFRDIQVMIPKGKMENLNIREVLDSNKMDDILTTFHHDAEFDEEPNANRNQRYRDNMNKLKTGDIRNHVEVIRELVTLNKKRPLGTDDKKLLENAQQFLISEIVLTKDVEIDQATTMLNEAIYQ
ncbi:MULTISPECIES: CarD family transcriptional regulator [Bacillales]|uniref:CarD family transcriptional regulator n=1 Tax=Bacillales TaxID=1385 RepID=UPI001CD43BF4|nr:CarD family transcriptional regulator [Alkalihalobacillus algicola]MCA0988821.1 CarD family transcriptional regulator [Alkalihalobacillus algicola]